MDRYMAIRKPIGYSRKLTTRQVNINIALVWFSTLVIVKLPHIIDYACIGTHDEDSAICDFLHGKEILVVILLLIFYLPLILMISFNVGTYRLALASLTLKRRRSKFKTKLNFIAHYDTGGGTEYGTVVNGGGGDSDSKEISRFSALMIQHKLSFTLGLIMLVFIVCWAPFFIVSTIICLCSECTQFLAPIHNFAIWLGVVNSGMNPIIHFILSRKFRTAIRSLFRLSSSPSKSITSPRPSSVQRPTATSIILPSKFFSNGI
ncbi:probable G-protein coupled receptor No18 isoform X2 [Panonychus citri]|nr:probable G-protein coupled receptor No18 isoform X2 [Panonychus citri]